jgi:hypothetical protein
MRLCIIELAKEGSANRRVCNLKTLAYTDLNAEGTLRCDATLSSFSREALIMTNRRGSTTARLVPAMAQEQLFELTQEHIRSLIGVIDRLNEVGAEDELRVISKQLTRLVFRAQPLPRAASSPKNRSARHRAALSPS